MDPVSTGIVYGGNLPGLVPEFEEREAAVFCHLNWTEWRLLDWLERAKNVAHFRLHHLVNLHKNDAVARKMKEKTMTAGAR